MSCLLGDWGWGWFLQIVILSVRTVAAVFSMICWYVHMFVSASVCISVSVWSACLFACLVLDN